MGNTRVLPTGRNLFPTDVEALPTKSAWKVGQELCDNLLKKYLEDENRFPESVGINLWSIDAFKSDGEIFCQILYLMGMRPVWADSGKVTKIEAIPLSQLRLVDGTADSTGSRPRPRVDVVVQTSGILRDMVPHFADLADEATVLASRLDEPHDLNFIKKHTDEQLESLKSELDSRYTENQMARMASYHIFSSPPGTYGIGVGLALDASAWEDEKDLTETYVNWGGHAYGSSRNKGFGRISGEAAQKLYAARLKTIDVTYMRQASPEYDILDCGCYGPTSTVSFSATPWCLPLWPPSSISGTRGCGKSSLTTAFLKFWPLTVPRLLRPYLANMQSSRCTGPELPPWLTALRIASLPGLSVVCLPPAFQTSGRMR